jgi:branched-chain amino acid transport system substrate-binding protein
MSEHEFPVLRPISPAAAFRGLLRGEISEEIRLQDVPIFQGLDRVDLAKLVPELEPYSFPQGTVLFEAGDPGDRLFIILGGTASVFSRKEGGEIRRVASLGPGECFGEMALLTGAPRSMSVQALTDLRVLSLRMDRFNRLLRTHGALAVYFAGILSSRLAAMDQATVSRKISSEGGTEEIPDGISSAPTGQQTLARDSYRGLGDTAAAAHGSCSGCVIPCHLCNRALAAVGRLRKKRLLGLLATGTACAASYVYFRSKGIPANHLIIGELLLGATVFWALDLFSVHAVSVALPVLAVLLGAAAPRDAFSGFSNPSWFLVLGVFALSAAIARTGLLYRFVLVVLRRFPESHQSKSFALSFAGLLLTPFIPSSIGRVALAGPLAVTMGNALNYPEESPGAVGLGMSALLGFGHMSFLFMNGAATSLLVHGLIRPPEGPVMWGSWFMGALPLGLSFFLLSYAGISILYRTKEKGILAPDTVTLQQRILGPMTFHEKVSMLAAVFSLAGFAAEKWTGVNGAWVALLAFVLLYSLSVLDDRGVRSEIDWCFLVSFGALLGIGKVISESGITRMLAQVVAPWLGSVSEHPTLFLLVVATGMLVLRMALPVAPALLLAVLAVEPTAAAAGIHPLVVGLVILASANPWFLPSQNNVYLSLLAGTEGRLFHHRQTLPAAFAYAVAVYLAVLLSVPCWKYLGLVK